MTAEEAKILTENSLLDYDKIKESIKLMAKAGCNYSVKDLSKIKDCENLKTQLESEGYTVSIKHGFFEINW